MRRGVTLVLPYVGRRRHVSRTLLPTTSAHFPAGSIKATRGVTTLQTFEIRAARKMWPSVVVLISLVTESLFPYSSLNCRHLLRKEIISGYDWYKFSRYALTLFGVCDICDHLIYACATKTSWYKNVEENALIEVWLNKEVIQYMYIYWHWSQCAATATVFLDWQTDLTIVVCINHIIISP